ncbi:MAG: hypothetical protein ACKVTZ_08975 [Bacteroidia bacterium]
MKIDFTKLQKLFIEKVRKEEGLILRGQEVSFEIRTNYEFSQYNLNVKLKVFGEEFSIGYPQENTTEVELIADFYARLHDYNTDDAQTHIIGLKICALEKRFAELIYGLREKILRFDKDLTSEDILIEVSDFVPSENDENGFPPVGIFVIIQGKQILSKKIEADTYTHILAKELESEVVEKMKTKF